jgi:hypothetical protein
MNRIKLFVAAFALLLLVATCGKEDPENPEETKKAQIERLTELSNRQANAIRSSLTPALTVENNISSLYWTVFKNRNQPPFADASAKDFLDSVKVHKGVVGNLYDIFGKPLPMNDATVAAFYATLDPYIQTMEELAKLQGR